MAALIPKPNMRRLHMTQVKRQFLPMILFVASGTLAFKVLYCDRRKKRYDEFFATYDCEAALKRMNDAGLMQSCPKN